MVARVPSFLFPQSINALREEHREEGVLHSIEEDPDPTFHWNIPQTRWDSEKSGDTFVVLNDEGEIESLDQGAALDRQHHLQAARGHSTPANALTDDRWGLPLRPPTPWDIETDYTYPNKVEFTVDEGTWMNVDIGSDFMIFDLLGDLYTAPLGGGAASLLLGGVAYEWQPKLSPDGSSVLYSSDKSGLDNLWVADIGCTSGGACTLSNHQQVSDETLR